ncbi:ATP-dependent Clp protease adaptor protein ClpS [Streptoalloteichus hindustanus]|uniref:ATP-dependent Clp protease adaptor protein ClpS n=1 Tax=Streptoalloteichus hindustanus TaxID=2017 RepID=A0A1M4XSQ6_STRHI|nr:ATP-dependent Clp protease adaptor protein ClpS [Streptoalloteichus hindustanus]
MLLLNDDINTTTTVAYLLHRLCALSVPGAVGLTRQVHERGSGMVGCFRGREEAEAFAARLQLHGLHGVVRSV